MRKPPSIARMKEKLKILALTREAFASEVQRLLQRGKQQAAALYSSFYQKGFFDPKLPVFKNCPALFSEIESLIDLSVPSIEEIKQDGANGKFLMKVGEEEFVESVLLSMATGWTICVSSQVGCRMGCRFCETARLGLKRSLLAEEIVAQIFLAKHVLKVPVRNVVFMGMGEPLDNFDAVVQAIRVMTDQAGLALGERRITVSTSGLAEAIEALADLGSPTPNLAVSVNASTDSIRNKIMPVNRRYALPRLRQSLEYYGKKSSREIFVEYVLLQGINDSVEDALELNEFLKGLPVKVNLIPYNPQKLARYQAPTMEVMERFAAVLREKGYRVLIRHNKGKKIAAACGQLAARHEQKLRVVGRNNKMEKLV